MSFSFKPQTEEEVLNLFKEGIYNFKVKAAEDKISQAGNPMIKLTLMVWDNAGNERYVVDYLMEKLMYKVKHFCDAVGLEKKYAAGAFEASDCINKTAQCKLRIEESDGYLPQNRVQDYLKGEEKAKKEEEPVFDNDADLPF